MNPLARCNREKFGNKEVPVSGRLENLSDYDTVLLGFSIWYGCAPNVVNTFCKDYDWSGKTVRVISTHEGSGLASMPSDVKKMCKGANVDMKGLAIKGSQAKNSKQKVAEWV